MAQDIEIPVGDSFAARHEQYLEQMGEEYEQIIRTTVEDRLHELTKDIERRSEQQLAAQAQAAEEE